MVRVKICGNVDAEHIAMCVEAGAHCLGFVVEYPVPVPWNLTREEASKLLPLVPPFVSRAVVTGGQPETVLAIADFLKPHIVQLHTDNPFEETALLAKELASRGIGLIKALRVDVATGQASGEISDPVEAALRIEQAGVSGLLLDAHTRDMPAGTGLRVSRDMARRVRDAVSVPFILAGGLTRSNVREAVEKVRPYGVDVITGVEARRCVKDPALVREFVRAVVHPWRRARR